MQILDNDSRETSFAEASSGQLHLGVSDNPLDPELIKILDIVTYSAEDLALLTALLMVTTRRRQAGVLAKRLLSVFGSLPKVLCAAKEDIRVLPGISEQTVCAIESAHSTILRTVALPLVGGPLMDLRALTTMVAWNIGQSPVELVKVIYFDKWNYVTGSEVICSGSETSVSVSLRTILRAAIRHGAYAIVVAHNHPGGRVDPSDHDLGLTVKLQTAGALIEIRILDHIIVSGDKWFSFRSVGYLD